MSGIKNAQSLQEAFELFNQMSRDLTDSYRELENQVARLKDELATAHDERLRTLIERERFANRLQQLLETLPGGVVVVDKEGRVVEKNPVASQLLGEPLLGAPWNDITARCFEPDADNPHERSLKTGGCVSISLSSTGTESERTILLTDVSEKRALQDLVNQRKRLTAMGDMVAALAHQVRTPLSAAVLYASHLAKADLREEHRLRFAHKLQERLAHLERQVNDMLVFASGGRIETAAFPLERLLSKVADAMEALAAMDSLQFRVEDRTAIESLTGNEDALLGILMNLLVNGLEAMNGAGALALTVTQPGTNLIRFSVADAGPGITDADRERIFEPFFTTRSHGTGLGLAVVEAIVRAHGGEVQCESSPGQGSVFHVTLPLQHFEEPLPGGSSGGRPEVRSIP